MNDDLISRQAAIEIVERYNKSHMLLKHQPMLGAASIIIELNELPSAQPIIHCESCKWFQCNMRPDGYLPKGVDEFECRHWCGPCDPIDFCSHAERRTDGVDS